MGNVCAKEKEQGDIIGISGVVVGGLVTIVIGAEYGIDYFGDALFYGVISGVIAAVIANAAEHHFNPGEMLAGGVLGFFEGIVCGVSGQ